MLEAFRLGGWGMYPTLTFGLLALSGAIGYALRPERRRLVLFGILSVVALLSGLLGTVTGIIKTLSFAAGLPNQAAVVAEGTSESLHVVALALQMLVIAGLVAVAGAFRSARGEGEASASATTQAA